MLLSHFENSILFPGFNILLHNDLQSSYHMVAKDAQLDTFMYRCVLQSLEKSEMELKNKFCSNDD